MGGGDGGEKEKYGKLILRERWILREEGRGYREFRNFAKEHKKRLRATIEQNFGEKAHGPGSRDEMLRLGRVDIGL